jgi:hypothetical protein
MSKLFFSSLSPTLSPHLECTCPKVRLSARYFSIASFGAVIPIFGAKAFTGSMIFGISAGSPG